MLPDFSEAVCHGASRRKTSGGGGRPSEDHHADAVHGVYDAHLGVFGQAGDERVQTCVLCVNMIRANLRMEWG